MIQNNQLIIKEIISADDFPMHLLYLADPSEIAVADYTKRGKIFGAYLQDKIVGECVLLPTRPFTLELINLAVDEEFQGKGIGKMLVNYSIDYAKANGYETIEVGTGNAGIGQLALYQKCGFSMTSIDIDFFRKHYDERMYENGIECRHMVRLTMDLHIKDCIKD